MTSEEAHQAHPKPADDVGDGLPGITITLPREGPVYRTNAALITTMAFPPKTADDPAFHRRVLHLCRCHWDEIDDKDPSWLAGPIPAPERRVDINEARQTRKSILGKLNRALGGTESLQPFFKQALAKAIAGGAWVPRQLGADQQSKLRILESHTPSLSQEIVRTLDREEEYKLSAPPSEQPPPRMPGAQDTDPVGHFKRDNLRRFRPVYHILTAFSLIRDDLAGAFTDPGIVVPKLLWSSLLPTADWATRTVDVAMTFERAIPFLSGLAGPEPDQVVRLRLR